MKAIRVTTGKRLMSLVMILFVLSIVKIGVTYAETDVTIGTGGVQGVYYPTGINICSMVNSKPEYEINCTAMSTGGSVFNINAVLSGTMQFGIAQSDRHYAAWNGIDEWQASGPQASLRSIFSIHHESVTLIAASDAGISTIDDLSGKVVNIGVEGSGGRKNAIDALDNSGINYLTDLTATDYPLSEAITKLQNSEIDGFFITIGHPNDWVKTATEGSRQVIFIPITNIENLINTHPYYTESIIPIVHYPNAENTSDVPTFGVKATFITSISVSDDIVYAFAKEVLDNFIEFQQLHPTYAILTKNNMLKALSAPIHPGAMKYYKEVIFIKGPAQCPGDFDNDGDIDGSDLAVFAVDFGRTDCPH